MVSLAQETSKVSADHRFERHLETKHSSHKDIKPVEFSKESNGIWTRLKNVEKDLCTVQEKALCTSC